MKRCTLLLLLALLAGCANDKDPVKPNPDPEPPPEPAYTFIYGDTLNATAQSPQVDIPWPSLANSPWPMAIVNQQGITRSPWPLLPEGHIHWYEPKVSPQPDSLYGALRYGLAVGPDGTIYAAARNLNMTAISTDGTTKWQLGAPYNPLTGPVVGTDSTIYYGTMRGFVAVKPSGEIKWVFKPELGFMEQRPFMGIDGTLYARLSRSPGRLYAITRDGMERWQTTVGYPSLNIITASPDGATLYVKGEGQTLLALDASTGAEIWRFFTGLNYLHHVSVDNAGNLYLCRSQTGTDRDIVSLSPGGQLRWTFATGEEFINGPNIVSSNGVSIAYNGYLYYGLLNRGTIALDYEGNWRWTFHPHETTEQPPTLCGPQGELLAITAFRSLFYKISESGHILNYISLSQNPRFSYYSYIFPSAVGQSGHLLLPVQNTVVNMN